MLKNVIKEILNEQCLGMCHHEQEHLCIYGDIIAADRSQYGSYSTFSPVLYVQDYDSYPINHDQLYRDMDYTMRKAIDNDSGMINMGLASILLSVWIYDSHSLYAAKDNFCIKKMFNCAPDYCTPDQIRNNLLDKYDVSDIDSFIARIKSLKTHTIDILNQYRISTDILGMVDCYLVADLEKISGIGSWKNYTAPCTRVDMNPLTLTIDVGGIPESVTVTNYSRLSTRQEIDIKRALRANRCD